jgi:translation initiation factor IF-3
MAFWANFRTLNFVAPPKAPRHAFPNCIPPPSCRAYTKTARSVRNLDIMQPVVQLVDPATKRLQPPTSVREIMSSINLNTHFVELVAEYPNPIVRVSSKKDAFDKLKASKEKKKLQAKQSIEEKEIQMTWGVARGDLAHKLNKVIEELRKGNRVELVFAPKKGQVVPTPRNMDMRVEEILDLIKDVGKEWKPREVRNVVTILHLQGAQPKTIV